MLPSTMKMYPFSFLGKDKFYTFILLNIIFLSSETIYPFLSLIFSLMKLVRYLSLLQVTFKFRRMLSS